MPRYELPFTDFGSAPVGNRITTPIFRAQAANSCIEKVTFNLTLQYDVTHVQLFTPGEGRQGCCRNSPGRSRNSTPNSIRIHQHQRRACHTAPLLNAAYEAEGDESRRLLPGMERAAFSLILGHSQNNGHRVKVKHVE